MLALNKKQAADRLAEVRTILSTFDIHPDDRNSDSLDFHDLPVWQLREMLEVAYTGGFEAGEKSNDELVGIYRHILESLMDPEMLLHHIKTAREDLAKQ